MSVADQFGKIFARQGSRPGQARPASSAEIARARAGGFAAQRPPAPLTRDTPPDAASLLAHAAAAEAGV